MTSGVVAHITDPFGATACQEVPGPRAGDELEAMAGRPARLLVVDDHPSNVALLGALLARAGFTEVASTTDPREAAALFVAAEPDLVLLDLHMPVLDGFAVMDQLAHLVEEGDEVPVVVLTADISPEVRTRALEAGAADFLTKPFESTEVVLRARNLLATRFRHLRVRDALRAHEAAEQRRHRDAVALVAEVEAMMSDGRVQPVFQPIVDLVSGEVVGFEALSRFQSDPPRPPNEWFADAASVGLGPELEVHALRRALLELDRVPEDRYVSVNLSPETVVTGRLAEVLAGLPADRVVLELTEHVAVDDYEQFTEAVADLREQGMRIAVDDAGAGFASFRHILRLCPDLIKLDLELTRAIDRDPRQRALASALVSFATNVGATQVAEGLETRQQLDTAAEIGIRYGQGYHLGRPAPLP
jgi:EAL domain-containing protein (putative c-di-GMP-specific phosphodiesterase class I)/ActR/RegA family two-component response regulator